MIDSKLWVSKGQSIDSNWLTHPAVFAPFAPVDPLTVPCTECGSSAGEKCRRMVFNRPVRTMAKGAHHQRRTDARFVDDMRRTLA